MAGPGPAVNACATHAIENRGIEIRKSKIPYASRVTDALPYRIAVLVYLFDAEGRVLLLHRRKPPNFELYSPVGGKLETPTGESPTACAVREVAEETGLSLSAGQLHLTGIVSETGYQGEGHWLMFLYEATAAIEHAAGEMDEGRLEWHDPADLDRLPIPETDRRVIWPLFWANRGGFFMAHIDCTTDPFAWTLDQGRPAPA
jgi:8-oxo-dGTP diphosphatase